MEKSRPAGEEVTKSIRASVEVADNLSEAEVLAQANKILEYIGLEVEDLRGRQTLDVGSGPCMVERAARDMGIDSVISLDRGQARMSKRPELTGRVVGDALALPFNDETFDLLISRGAVPGHPSFYTDQAGQRKILPLPEQEKITMAQMTELLRVLKSSGEARISPPVLAFICRRDEAELQKMVRELWDENNRWIGSKEASIRYGQKLLAYNHQSTEYLKSHGYNVELITRMPKPNIDPRDIHFYDYWVIRK